LVPTPPFRSLRARLAVAQRFGHVARISTSARSRTPWGGFGGRLLSQEHTRVFW
jgi:hypothetical protein